MFNILRKAEEKVVDAVVDVLTAPVAQVKYEYPKYEFLPAKAEIRKTTVIEALIDGLAEVSIMNDTTVMQFLDERCTITPYMIISPYGCNLRSIYFGYIEWCNKNGVTPLPKELFKKRLESYGYEVRN